MRRDDKNVAKEITMMKMVGKMQGVVQDQISTSPSARAINPNFLSVECVYADVMHEGPTGNKCY